MFLDKTAAWKPESDQAIAMASLLMGLIKMSSERYDQGILSEEEASAILDFAYIPLRFGYAGLQWQNPEVQAPVWSFDRYYDALVNINSSFKKETESS
jgi:hypothetical protein